MHVPFTLKVYFPYTNILAQSLYLNGPYSSNTCTIQTPDICHSEAAINFGEQYVILWSIWE